MMLRLMKCSPLLTYNFHIKSTKLCILCPVLGPSLREGHRGAGARLEKSKEAGEGSRKISPVRSG